MKKILKHKDFIIYAEDKEGIVVDVEGAELYDVSSYSNEELKEVRKDTRKATDFIKVKKLKKIDKKSAIVKDRGGVS